MRHQGRPVATRVIPDAYLVRTIVRYAKIFAHCVDTVTASLVSPVRMYGWHEGGAEVLRERGKPRDSRAKAEKAVIKIGRLIAA